jgi:hypothetical protein
MQTISNRQKLSLEKPVKFTSKNGEIKLIINNTEFQALRWLSWNNGHKNIAQTSTKYWNCFELFQNLTNKGLCWKKYKTSEFSLTPLGEQILENLCAYTKELNRITNNGSNQNVKNA